MKDIVQRMAILAFFGCMTLVGIAAHNKHEETCRQEWKAGFSTTDSTVVKKTTARFLFTPAGIMNFVWQ